MNIFWENIWKFPKFIISVFIGFFLTAAYPFFQLSKNRKIFYFIFSIIILIAGLLVIVLKEMLGYT
uniref:Uncharacterized protein ycf33 n=1 Tax=Neoizziella asiatica TaxID=1077397 RepID=A0A1G4NX53_9FLOR|nr:Hypothetical protein ycf33 [Neoizziella asiatica]SCW23261.1 Hypothetical protein ycf33 [Neoizziella asiatica]